MKRSPACGFIDSNISFEPAELYFRQDNLLLLFLMVIVTDRQESLSATGITFLATTDCCSALYHFCRLELQLLRCYI